MKKTVRKKLKQGITWILVFGMILFMGFSAAAIQVWTYPIFTTPCFVYLFFLNKLLLFCIICELLVLYRYGKIQNGSERDVKKKNFLKEM